MSNVIRIKKGLNIPLQGKAEKIFVKDQPSETYAIKPPDFEGVMPKLLVKTDDQVKEGTPLFFDKKNPGVQFVSPASGTVVSVNRGERRRILEIIIKADGQEQREEYKPTNPDGLGREEIIQQLLKAGLWPFVRQRPYGIIAKPDDTPKAIFISAFDTSPLGPDLDFVVTGEEKNFQTGIDAIKKLTDGQVHLNVDSTYPASSVFTKAKNVQINRFKGPHPAGNVGIQIHHLDPLAKGEIIWYLAPQDIITIGRFFQEGVFDSSRIVALTGSEVLKPRYFKTRWGASIQHMVENNVTGAKLRFISGNALTGTKIRGNGYIGFYDSQVTIIPEGDEHEFFGWAKPGLNKFSASGAFLSKLIPGRRYRLNTNLHGGKRAYVMTGQYEKVVPMDIYPVQLVKAIMTEDIDKMEQLGIYEVIEEDLALCDYVCTSKTDVQAILREGINLMIKELS